MENEVIFLQNMFQDVENEDEQNQKNISEKFIYYFDYPHLTESGYVEVKKNKIILLFPEKKNFTALNAVKYNQTVNVYLNKEPRFSYEWLPIYSSSDFYKIKDMLYKTYYEFKNLANILHNENFYPMYVNEILTEHNSDNYNITCFEASNNISFEINIKKKQKNNESDLYIKKNESFLDPQIKHIILQIFIGKNLIFCSKRDLLHHDIPVNDVHFIIELLLLKIIR
jgi:hypothetical protein